MTFFLLSGLPRTPCVNHSRGHSGKTGSPPKLINKLFRSRIRVNIIHIISSLNHYFHNNFTVHRFLKLYRCTGEDVL